MSEDEALFIMDTAKHMTKNLGKSGAIRRITKILAQDTTMARRLNSGRQC